jgi:hypothetical protein
VVVSDAPKRRQGFWLTVGEIVGVLALVIAALNYWDSHKQHTDEVRQVSAEQRARAAFVVTGTADSEGRRIALKSLKPSQAIQSQRYYFPRSILDHPMEVTAAEPQIDLGWIEDGLRKLSEGGAKSGERTIPVAIRTTFVEDGDTRVDTSLYRIGYRWSPRLFGGPKIVLQGIELTRRAIKGDPTAALG